MIYLCWGDIVKTHKWRITRITRTIQGIQGILAWISRTAGSDPATVERQLSYLKCFVMMPLWQSNNLGIILCHKSFLLHFRSLTRWKLLPSLENIWLFSYDRNKILYFTQFKWLVTRVYNYFYCFIGITVSQLKSVTVAICQMNSISFMHAVTPVLAPTKLDAPLGHNL